MACSPFRSSPDDRALWSKRFGHHLSLTLNGQSYAERALLNISVGMIGDRLHDNSVSVTSIRIPTCLVADQTFSINDTALDNAYLLL